MWCWKLRFYSISIITFWHDDNMDTISCICTFGLLMIYPMCSIIILSYLLFRGIQAVRWWAKTALSGSSLEWWVLETAALIPISPEFIPEYPSISPGSIASSPETSRVSSPSRAQTATLHPPETLRPCSSQFLCCCPSYLSSFLSLCSHNDVCRAFKNPPAEAVLAHI